MKIRLTLDTAAVGILVLLTILVGLVLLIGAQAGVRVSANLPGQAVVAPFQTIKLTFSEPVDSEMAASVISMDPVLDGYLEWLDARTVQFVPVRPFELDTVYKLSISPEILTANGHALKKAHAWEFTVREPLVAYLVTDSDQSSIWAVDLKNSLPQRLTDESVKVISLVTARSGGFHRLYCGERTRRR